MVGQAGKLVLVGGAARRFFAGRQFAARPAQLPERNAGESDQAHGHAGEHRHQPMHRPHHRLLGVEGEKADDAALRVDHRLHLAAGDFGSVSNFNPLRPALLLDHAHKARIDLAGCAKQRAEFGDRVAQRLALLQRRWTSSPRRANS